MTDPITLTNIVQLIRDVGFPIVMVLWFMLRTDRLIRELTRVVNELLLTLKETKR